MRRGESPAVLLGGLANAVSVARSLASVGVPVHALGSGDWDVVCHSRACVRYARPVGSDVQTGWLRWLEQEAAALAGAVVLPCGDDGVELIARNRNRLDKLGYRVWEADDAVSLAMLDKARTYELAAKAGVPVPRTITLREPADRARAAEELGFPLVLKPLYSHLFARHVSAAKVVMVSARSDLERVVDDLAARGVEMLATEFVPGPASNLVSYYSYIDESGEPLFHLTKRKLRQFPLDFGTTCLETTEWDAEAAALGIHFYRQVGLRGLAATEFKRDARDGRLKLIECNHRFTGSHELVRAAGIDLAQLAYSRAAGLPLPSHDVYRDGVYLWGPILDAHACLAARRRGELSVGRWLAPLLHRQHFPVFHWRDPKPSVVDVIRRTRLFVRKNLTTGATPAPSGSTG